MRSLLASVRGLFRFRSSADHPLVLSPLAWPGVLAIAALGDGTLYWRTPYAEDAIGASFSHLPLFQREVPRRPSNVYRTIGLVDGVPKTVSYRTVEGLPFIVTVALDERAMLATWRRTALGAVTATSLLVSLVILGFVLMSRHARHNVMVHDRMAQAQKLEALGRMMGGLAHDFGNVLNVVALNLALLRKHSEHVPAEVDKAISAVRQGTTLASQLLAFAREQRLIVEPCDANRERSGSRPRTGQS